MTEQTNLKSIVVPKDLESGKNGSFRSSVTENENSSERETIVESAILASKGAEFVAIDTELTGLFLGSNRSNNEKNAHNHYQRCADGASKMLMTQIGFCFAHRDLDKPNEWLLKPFSFYACPKKKTLFSAESTTFYWLRRNGFSFDKWIDEAYDYAPLAVIKEWEQAEENFCNEATEDDTDSLKTTLNDSKRKSISGFDGLKRCGLQRIMEAIIENSVPVVVHNGLIDLLHFHSKLIQGEVPPSLKDFCDESMRIFCDKPGNAKTLNGGIFDTKHIACEYKVRAFGLSETSSTSLEFLHGHLKAKKKDIFRWKLDKIVHGVNTLDKCDMKLKPHDACQDAIMTAESFLLELEGLITMDMEPFSKKRKIDNATAESDKMISDEQMAKVADWKNNDKVQGCLNFIARKFS